MNQLQPCHNVSYAQALKRGGNEGHSKTDREEKGVSSCGSNNDANFSAVADRKTNDVCDAGEKSSNENRCINDHTTTNNDNTTILISSDDAQTNAPASANTVVLLDRQRSELITIDASQIVHMPQSEATKPNHTNNTNTQAEGRGSRQRYPILCDKYHPNRPEECPNDRCSHVHAITSEAKKRTPIHINYAWRCLEDCTYARFPPGKTVTVHPPAAVSTSSSSSFSSLSAVGCRRVQPTTPAAMDVMNNQHLPCLPSGTDGQGDGTADSNKNNKNINSISTDPDTTKTSTVTWGGGGDGVGGGGDGASQSAPPAVCTNTVTSSTSTGPAVDTVDSGYIIETRVVYDDEKRPPVHCAHFYYHRECTRGRQCTYAHVVYIKPSAGEYEHAPPPSVIMNHKHLEKHGLRTPLSLFSNPTTVFAPSSTASLSLHRSFGTFTVNNSQPHTPLQLQLQLQPPHHPNQPCSHQQFKVEEGNGEDNKRKAAMATSAIMGRGAHQKQSSLALENSNSTSQYLATNGPPNKPQSQSPPLDYSTAAAGATAGFSSFGSASAIGGTTASGAEGTAGAPIGSKKCAAAGATTSTIAGVTVHVGLSPGLGHLTPSSHTPPFPCQGKLPTSKPYQPSSSSKWQLPRALTSKVTENHGGSSHNTEVKQKKNAKVVSASEKTNTNNKKWMAILNQGECSLSEEEETSNGRQNGPPFRFRRCTLAPRGASGPPMPTLPQRSAQEVHCRDERNSNNRQKNSVKEGEGEEEEENVFSPLSISDSCTPVEQNEDDEAMPADDAPGTTPAKPLEIEEEEDVEGELALLSQEQEREKSPSPPALSMPSPPTMFSSKSHKSAAATSGGCHRLAWADVVDEEEEEEVEEAMEETSAEDGGKEEEGEHSDHSATREPEPGVPVVELKVEEEVEKKGGSLQNNTTNNPCPMISQASTSFSHRPTVTSTSAPPTPHINRAWSSVEACEYPRFPAGCLVFANEPKSSNSSVQDCVNSGSILRTKNPKICSYFANAAKKKKAKRSPSDSSGEATEEEDQNEKKLVVSESSPVLRVTHCAHFYFGRECHLGDQCTYAHVVYVKPDALPNELAPAPSTIGRHKPSSTTGCHKHTHQDITSILRPLVHQPVTSAFITTQSHKNNNKGKNGQNNRKQPMVAITAANNNSHQQHRAPPHVATTSTGSALERHQQQQQKQMFVNYNTHNHNNSNSDSRWTVTPQQGSSSLNNPPPLTPPMGVSATATATAAKNTRTCCDFTREELQELLERSDYGVKKGIFEAYFTYHVPSLPNHSTSTTTTATTNGTAAAPADGGNGGGNNKNGSSVVVCSTCKQPLGYHRTMRQQYQHQQQHQHQHQRHHHHQHQQYHLQSPYAAPGHVGAPAAAVYSSSPATPITPGIPFGEFLSSPLLTSHQQQQQQQNRNSNTSSKVPPTAAAQTELVAQTAQQQRTEEAVAAGAPANDDSTFSNAASTTPSSVVMMTSPPSSLTPLAPTTTVSSGSSSSSTGGSKKSTHQPAAAAAAVAVSASSASPVPTRTPHQQPPPPQRFNERVLLLHSSPHSSRGEGVHHHESAVLTNAQNENQKDRSFDHRTNQFFSITQAKAVVGGAEV